MDKQRQLDDFFGIPSPEEIENGGEKAKGKNHISLKEALNQNNRNLKARLKLLPKVLSTKERYIILALLLLMAGSVIAIPIVSYFHFTTAVADKGGTIREGIIGEPRHINPLLSQSDADRDMVKLVYSGLFKYNETGKLIPDMAKSHEVSQDELNYTVYLREDAKWHDGKPITADDVIFTIQIAKNGDYGSLQRINWQGVEIEATNDHTLIFKLKNKYAQFLNNLTLPILPQHLWENVKPINFALSELNLKPIGSGPYRFKKLQKDETGRITFYELGAFEDFYAGRPLIDKIRLRFYESEDSLIDGYNKNDIDNISLISPKNIKKIKFRQRLVIKELKMPRYFGAFFNQNQSKILSDKNIRLALAHATDKESLIRSVLEEKGTQIHSPILGIIPDIDQEPMKYDFNRNTAKDILLKNGWDKTDENGILIKKDEKLVIKLTTSTWPELVEVAQKLKEQWKEVGIDLQIETLPTVELQQVIRDRNYQLLLFGEILSLDPDPFSLWHSSQKRDPGLNLALYDNKAVDTLLEDARKTLDPPERTAKYMDFQKIVVDELPALFLYSPHYLYGQSKKINGFDTEVIGTPTDRLTNVNDWYVETKRVWR